MVTRKVKHKQADGTVLEADIGVLAENVLEDENHRFVTDAEKEAISKGQNVRHCYVGQSGSATTNPWYKFASVVMNVAYDDRIITFKVSKGHEDFGTAVGILTAHIRTNGTKTYQNSALVWEYVGSKIELEDFVLAYKSTENTSTEIGLWAKVDTAYASYHFEVLAEHSRTSFGDYFTLYTKCSAGSEAAIPSDFTQVQSKLLSLQNVTNTIDAKVKWTWYSRVSDIGLTISTVTIQAIETALPNYSVLEFAAFKSDYPAFAFGGTGTRHKIKVTKPVAGYIVAEDFDVDSNTLYVASKSGATNTWSAWQAVAKNTDLEALKKSVADGKKMVADAVSGKGITTAADATFATIAENVGKIIKATGNATAAQVLSGKTFSNASGSGTGTMPDKRNTPQKINYYRINNNRFEVAVDKGYYEAAWDADCYEYMEFATLASCIGLTKYKLLANTTVLGITGDAAVMNTSTGNAAATDIASGKIAFVNGKKITGSAMIYKKTSSNDSLLDLSAAMEINKTAYATLGSFTMPSDCKYVMIRLSTGNYGTDTIAHHASDMYGLLQPATNNSFQFMFLDYIYAASNTSYNGIIAFQIAAENYQTNPRKFLLKAKMIDGSEMGKISLDGLTIWNMGCII